MEHRIAREQKALDDAHMDRSPNHIEWEVRSKSFDARSDAKEEICKPVTH